jgi:hypothetical protein
VPDAGERALNALSRVNEIGFPEFTAKLVNDTVDAIVGATVKQLKSYAELVAEVAQGLAAFKSKAVTVQTVNQYLAEAYPKGDGTAIMAGETYDQAMYDDLVARFGPIDGLVHPEGGEAVFTADTVSQIRTAVQKTLEQAAELSYDTLKTMVEMGYARVIFTNGRIKTKLTFNVTAVDTSNRQTSDLAQSAFSASAKMKGGIFGKIFGISGRTSYSAIRVRTVNEQSAAATVVKGDILGEVEINFATMATG